MTIPYSRQFISPHDIKSVTAALESDFLTCGPLVTRFESRLCEVTGAKFAIACSSGTAALHLCCLALGIGPGSQGLTTATTFLASSNCFEYCGAFSDFLDIDQATLCISPKAVDRYCRTVQLPKVVTAVSFAGVPAPLPELRALSQQHGFYLIEDAAHSLGSSYTFEGIEYQSGSCAHSDLAILSFHPVKTVTTAEGGAITTNDPGLAEKLRLFRSHGMVRDSAQMSRCDGPWYYEMQELGYHYRLPDVQCALGISQLDLLDSSKARRQQLVKKYTQNFQGNSKLIAPPWPKDTSPCFHLYPLQFAEGMGMRKKAYEHLLAQGIHSQVHYIPVYWQPYYKNKYGYEIGKCPNAEQYYSGCLSIPLYYGLSDQEQDRVIESILEIIK